MLNKIYRVGVNDNKFWRKDLLAIHLYRCLIDNTTTTLDVTPEGSSCHASGLFRYLDAFCEETGYAKSNITINTGNMIEQHAEYKIKRDAQAWFEIPIMQQWTQTNGIDTGVTPTLHFGHFIGKSNWNRLWIGAVLHSKYSDKLFQTYNTGIGTHYLTKNDGLCDFVGLEDLVKNECDQIDVAVEFLKYCPKFIPEEIEAIKNMATYIKQQDYYPIQLPANLNILQYYNNIFVDVIHETFVRDEVCFATEKTWRTVLARRPFITMGGRHHLANLRKLGFQTFNNIWDEGYDDYGMQWRVREILKLIDTIGTWPVEKMQHVLQEMQPILDHNYNVFMTLTHQKIQKIFND
jgi:hypothetical protein